MSDLTTPGGEPVYDVVRAVARRPVPHAPSEICDQAFHRLFDSLYLGHSFDRAAILAGISPSELRGWIARAEQPDAPPEYAELARSCHYAKAMFADYWLKYQHDHPNVKSAAFMLERGIPDEWSPIYRNEVEGVKARQRQGALDHIPEEERDQVLRELTEASAQALGYTIVETTRRVTVTREPDLKRIEARVDDAEAR